MRNKILAVSALLLTTVATPALAQEETSAFTINGGATLVSDYRFRGLSQTDKNFAVQGSLTVTHATGLYASVWGSSIDDYVANGSDQEIDLIAGYKTTVGPVTLDAGVLYYFYPGSNQGFKSLLVGGPKYRSDFVEPYVAISGAIGPVTAKVTANYAPKQRALAWNNVKDDNLYTGLDLSAAVPDTGLSFTGHIGHNWAESFLSVGRHYTDWSFGAAYTIKNFTVGVQYVGTNIPKNYPATSGLAAFGIEDIAKDGVVASIGVSF